MNLLASLPSASRSTKHFWLARIVARITSGGISRNSALEFAHQHDRPFDEAGDFLQQPLVLDEFEPLREGQALGVGEDHLLAPVGVEHDLRLVERVDIILEAADADRFRREETVAVGDVAPAAIPSSEKATMSGVS